MRIADRTDLQGNEGTLGLLSCSLPSGEDQWWKEKVKLLIRLDMSIPIGCCRLVVIMTSPLGSPDRGLLSRLGTS